MINTYRIVCAHLLSNFRKSHYLNDCMSIILSNLCVSLLLSALFFPTFVQADSPLDVTVQSQHLTGNWYYSWSAPQTDPRDAQWNDSPSRWTAIDFPADLPDKNGNVVWLRLDVPEGGWRDPHIYISSIDLTVQVFENRNLIYQFGDFAADGSSQFNGWPWHIIPIEKGSLGKTIYLRVFSDYPYIGLSGEALIGNKAELLAPVYQRGIIGVLFVTLVCLAGLMSMSIGIVKNDLSLAVATGVMSVDLSLMMFAENELSQVLYYDPLLWRYVAAFTYFLVPVFLSWVLWGWLKQKRPFILLPALLCSVGFVGVTAGLTIFTEFSFVNAYPPFDLFFIVVVLLLLVFCARPLNYVGLQGQVVVFSIVALFVSLVVDMLSAHGFIAWMGKAGQWGLVLFAISSLSIYLIKDWRQQVVLSILTNTLELQVEERTKELQESKRKLEKLAREDFLTGLLNRRAFMEQAAKEVANAVRHKRPLSLVLFDIDFFKTINDEYGHATGDEVLRKLSAVARKQCREGDLICRYGGEEFVILLHATMPEDAKNLVERLQRHINDLVISPSENINITVTASFGLVSLVDEDHSVSDADRLLARLLSSADDAMYNVKKTGRNGIESCVLQGKKNTLQ